MKQRRIEERRERRGRDPVTGAMVAVVESGKGKGKVKMVEKGRGMGMKVNKVKGKGEKVASGRVGKVSKR